MIAKGRSKRRIRRDLKVYGITINRYLDISSSLGINPAQAAHIKITDDLCHVIKARIVSPKPKEPPPRVKIILPVKGRIEDYLKQGITNTKITFLAREGICVTESSFYRFVKAIFPHIWETE
jgi:hypothetical protein